jgi:hypothetical protein
MTNWTQQSLHRAVIRCPAVINQIRGLASRARCLRAAAETLLRGRHQPARLVQCQFCLLAPFERSDVTPVPK